MKKCQLCKSEITSGSKSGFCKHCAFTGNKNPNYKGKNTKKYSCIDCKKRVFRKETKRCAKCHGIWERDKNHPNYKHGKTHNNNCIDCGKHVTYTAKRCYSCESSGLRSNFYIDGNGYLPYTAEFTLRLRERIRNRDDNKCVICGMLKREHLKKYSRNLEVHHKDHNKKNCNEDNLETRCKKCNLTDNFKK
jgi:hypothetical protein